MHLLESAYMEMNEYGPPLNITSFIMQACWFVMESQPDYKQNSGCTLLPGTAAMAFVCHILFRQSNHDIYLHVE